jgi:hypothetical protein
MFAEARVQGKVSLRLVAGDAVARQSESRSSLWPLGCER